MSDHYDQLETRDPQQRREELLRRVSEQIAHAKTATRLYANLFSEVDPASIDSAEAVAGLPVTRKSELMDLQQRDRPFGGLSAVTGSNLAYIFASPGPIYEPGSRRGDFWHFARTLHAAGFRAGDLIQNCFSYHFTPAGAMIDGGAHALGCTVIPAGTGQTELQVQTIGDLRPDGYVGTPSFLKIILEKAEALGTDAGCLRKALVSGEALPPALRAGFAEKGIQTFQCYATADAGVIAYESEAREGLIVDEEIYLEIVRPGTGEPVSDGEVGEVVITSLNPDYPLIRFATGDLSAVLPGSSPCGRTNLRIKGWMGRADQTAKVRGMFIHPSQLNLVMKRHPEVTRVRLVVDWINEADEMTLQCETLSASDGLAAAVKETIRSICKVRGEVEFKAPGSLPNDGKIIDDIRRYD